MVAARDLSLTLHISQVISIPFSPLIHGRRVDRCSVAGDFEGFLRESSRRGQFGEYRLCLPPLVRVDGKRGRGFGPQGRPWIEDYN